MTNGAPITKTISLAEVVGPITLTGFSTRGEIAVQDDVIPRDFYVEAKMAMKGLPITITVAHLEAMQEFHECSLIRIANRLDETKKTILEMP